MPIELVKNNLQELHRQGIVDYKPQNDKPQIILLKNRMYKDDFKINEKDLTERKEKHLQRIQAIIKYSNNNSACRSKIIGNYFNDQLIAECGICDNCVSKNNLPDSKEISAIIKIIKKELKTETKTQLELVQSLTQFKKVNISKALKFLENEGEIIMDESGIINLV